MYRKGLQVLLWLKCNEWFRGCLIDAELLGPDGVLAPQHGPETISAAPHGNGLTWKNSGLNTGAHVVPLGSRRADTTAIGSLAHWVTGKRGWARAISARGRCARRLPRVSPRGP